MLFKDLSKYTEQNNFNFISGGKPQEINYLKFHHKRFNELDKITKTLPHGKLLDIGTTPFTIYLAETSQHKIFALDYNDFMKERCNNYKINFKSCDLAKNEMPYDKLFFDSIIFAEVLEHLHTSPIKVLNKLNLVLKNGGTLILGTPNMASMSNRIKLLFNKPILEYPTFDNEVHGHDRIYIKSELTEYLKQSGFKIEKIKYSSAADFNQPTNNKRKAIIRKIFQLTTLPLRLLFPSLNGTIIITASKVSLSSTNN